MQKVIVRVSIADEKSRKKAMKTVVSHTGVVSATLQGQDKNQIEVIGEGIDSAVLTRFLRKNVGHAELVSVNPIPEKKTKRKMVVTRRKAMEGKKMIPVARKAGRLRLYS